MGWEFKLKDDIEMKTIRYTWLVATLLVVGLLASCSPKGAKKLLETIPQESLFVGYCNGADLIKKGNFEKYIPKDAAEDENFILLKDLVKSVKLHDLFFFITPEKNLTFTFFVKDFKQFRDASSKLGYGEQGEEKEGYWIASNNNSTIVSNKKQVWIFSNDMGLAPLEAVKKYVEIKPENNANTIPHISDIYTKDAGMYMNYALLTDLEEFRGLNFNHNYAADEDIDWRDWEEDLEELSKEGVEQDEVEAIEEESPETMDFEKALPMLKEQKDMRVIATISFEKKEIRSEIKLYDPEGKPYTSPFMSDVKVTKELLANFPKDVALIAVSSLGEKALDAVCQALALTSASESEALLAKQVICRLGGEIAAGVKLPSSIMDWDSAPEYMLLAQSKNSAELLLHLDTLLCQGTGMKSSQNNGVYHLDEDFFNSEKGAYYGALNNYVYYRNAPFIQPKESALENKYIASFVGSYGGLFVDLSSQSSLSTLVKQFTEYSLDGYLMVHMSSPHESTIVFRNDAAEGDNILEGFVKRMFQA